MTVLALLLAAFHGITALVAIGLGLRGASPLIFVFGLANVVSTGTFVGLVLR